MTAVPTAVNYRLLGEIRVVVVGHASYVLERPIRDDRLANDVVDRNGTEDSRVGAVPAVVAEDEDRALGHDDSWHASGCPFVVPQSVMPDRMYGSSSLIPFT